MIDAAWRLVSYGNAFLLGRYDGDALAKAVLPMLAPSTHPLAARRLMAAVLQAQHADDGTTIRAALLAAANTIA